MPNLDVVRERFGKSLLSGASTSRPPILSDQYLKLMQVGMITCIYCSLMDFSIIGPIRFPFVQTNQNIYLFVIMLAHNLNNPPETCFSDILTNFPQVLFLFRRFLSMKLKEYLKQNFTNNLNQSFIPSQPICSTSFFLHPSLESSKTP
jgi:hypothetical protein